MGTWRWTRFTDGSFRVGGVKVIFLQNGEFPKIYLIFKWKLWKILCFNCILQYGFVNYALELLVLRNFGEETWDEIK